MGQTLGIDKQPFEIVGVLDRTFRYPARAEVWAAAPMEPTALERSSFNYPTVARWRRGTGLEAASARLETLGAQLANAHPAANRNKRFVPIPLREHLVGQVRNTLYLFRSFLLLGGVDLGYRPERLLVMYAHAPAASDDEYVRVARELNEVLPELPAVPGVRAAAAG